MPYDKALAQDHTYIGPVSLFSPLYPFLFSMNHSLPDVVEMAVPMNRRIPTGEWVMVTGANGYIASHIVDILLQEGYNVRGTVRSHEEAP